MKLLNHDDFKEINDIGFRLSKYNEHIILLYFFLSTSLSAFSEVSHGYILNLPS